MATKKFARPTKKQYAYIRALEKKTDMKWTGKTRSGAHTFINMATAQLKA